MRKKIVIGTTDNGTYEAEVSQNGFDGYCNLYDSSGKLTHIYNYKNDKREGPFKNFYSDGSLQSEGEYRQGELLYSFTYYTNGLIAKKILSNHSWVRFHYFTGERLFSIHYTSKNNTVSDSTIYYTYSNKEQYKHFGSVRKLYKWVDSKYEEVDLIGKSEEEFIKVILGKDKVQLDDPGYFFCRN